MKRIIRRKFLTDAAGRLLSQQVEELTDDEQGTVAEVSAGQLCVCESCGRPLEKVEDHASCETCLRAACMRCLTPCAVCQKLQCGRCKTGFAEKGLSVCAACLAVLEERVARADRLLDEKTAFERAMSVYGARMKLLQLAAYEGGPILEILSQIEQVRLTRSLERLERRLMEDQDNDRRRLP